VKKLRLMTWTPGVNVIKIVVIIGVQFIKLESLALASFYSLVKYLWIRPPYLLIALAAGVNVLKNVFVIGVTKQ